MIIINLFFSISLATALNLAHLSPVDEDVRKLIEMQNITSSAKAFRIYVSVAGDGKRYKFSKDPDSVCGCGWKDLFSFYAYKDHGLLLSKMFVSTTSGGDRFKVSKFSAGVCNCGWTDQFSFYAYLEHVNLPSIKRYYVLQSGNGNRYRIAPQVHHSPHADLKEFYNDGWNNEFMFYAFQADPDAPTGPKQWTKIGNGLCLDSKQNGYSWYKPGAYGLKHLKLICEVTTNCVGVSFGDWGEADGILNIQDVGQDKSSFEHKTGTGTGDIMSTNPQAHARAVCYGFK